MSARPKLPEHGTPARYRLELRAKRDGNGPGPCDRCRSAESQRRKDRRSDAAASEARSHLHVIGDGQDERTESTDTDASNDPPKPGRMELAVQADIDEIAAEMRVPFHHSLSELALDTAREIDDPKTAYTARSQARRQLFEVLKSLRTRKEGDDNSAVAIALQAAGFGVPLVPGRDPSAGDAS